MFVFLKENSIIAETFLKSMKLDKVLPDLKTYGILLNYYARYGIYVGIGIESCVKDCAI